MAEFALKSRKNETNTPDFEVEKLQEPTVGQSLEFLESKVTGIRLKNRPGTLPCLPWQLERVLSAASSNVLNAKLPGVPDVGRYTLAWGCSYLTGDRDEAEQRLWQVYRAWKGVNIMGRLKPTDARSAPESLGRNLPAHSQIELCKSPRSCNEISLLHTTLDVRDAKSARRQSPVKTP